MRVGLVSDAWNFDTFVRYVTGRSHYRVHVCREYLYVRAKNTGDGILDGLDKFDAFTGRSYENILACAHCDIGFREVCVCAMSEEVGEACCEGCEAAVCAQRSNVGRGIGVITQAVQVSVTACQCGLEMTEGCIGVG